MASSSGLKEWADVRAPKDIALEHDYMRTKATEASWNANDASIRANATGYHADRAETTKLHEEARNAHADAAKQWKAVGGPDGHEMAEKHEAAASEHHDKHNASKAGPRNPKGHFTGGG